MRIESFKLNNVDDFGGRSAEIRTSKLNFETPTRALTSTEYNYKKRLRIEEPFDNSVGEIVARFNTTDIENFRTTNGSYLNRLRTAGTYADQMRYVVSKLYPQYPFNYFFDEETIRLLIELQVESGLDTVSIPHRAQEQHDLLPHYVRWADYAEEYAVRLGMETVPVPYVPIRLREEFFRSTIEGLWDMSSRFPIIGLVYGSIRANKINYSFLRVHGNDETWLHMSAVPRVSAGRSVDNLARIHLPQIYGIDTVSASIPWGGGGPPLEDYQRLRYFDESSLSLPRIREWVHAHGTDRTECSCVVCQKRPFDEIVREFAILHGPDRDLSPLFGVFRLHEVFRSSEAFDEGRGYISENDFAEYLEERIGRAIEEHRP